jgi:hypothetical protein
VIGVFTGHLRDGATMTQDLEAISNGVVAWMARRPYHDVRDTSGPKFHTFFDCPVGLRTELRYLRVGDGGRELCPDCRERAAASQPISL